MSVADHPQAEMQSARSVLMVRPARFGCNPQTAHTNAFQRIPEAGFPEYLQTAVLREFDALADALSGAGVEVLVAPDSDEPAKPDAVFPNNWVSFHHDGTVALYPMLAPNRRAERREDILEHVVRKGGFRVSRTVDLSHREAEAKFLEGTGSVVLDRVHRIAYACSSPRTDLDVLGEFAQLLDYNLMTFDALDRNGRLIYHTNVMMAIGTGFAVICAESFSDTEHRAAVLGQLRATGHEIVDITQLQMTQFAGNVLELASLTHNVLALSTTALASLDCTQRDILEAHTDLLPVSIPTIEHVGGGGVRCMLAEIHLPKRHAAARAPMVIG